MQRTASAASSATAGAYAVRRCWCGGSSSGGGGASDGVGDDEGAPVPWSLDRRNAIMAAYVAAGLRMGLGEGGLHLSRRGSTCRLHVTDGRTKIFCNVELKE